MILILAKLLEMVSVNLFWRFVLLMLAEKKKGKKGGGEIVISVILRQFIFLPLANFSSSNLACCSWHFHS
jgi:hypothetical protein